MNSSASVTQYFRGGRWVRIESLPFSDPMLTPAHRIYAGAVAATELARGSSQQQAVQVAEKRMYERIYGGGALVPSGALALSRVARKQHRAPEDKKEESSV